MDVVHEARSAHARGRLVPFLGSGMSRPVCRHWPGMIAALERSAGLGAPAVTERRDDLALISRAARALEVLRLGRGWTVSDSVRSVLLEGAPAEPPAQTRALAELHWPLVVTTNYDDLYAAAVHQRELDEGPLARGSIGDLERQEPVVQVVGRNSVDSHRVLSGLSRPGRPMLWALQGYLGGQALIRPQDGPVMSYATWSGAHGDVGDRADRAALERQIVVGHAEYRRVALRSEGFRRSFAEVFRSRSMLFLGSGLADRYLLDLFSQVLELYGPSVHPHFAVAKARELDVDFLRRYFGIWVHEIADHDDLPRVIRELARSDGTPRFHRTSHAVSGRTDARLTVTAAALPPSDTPATCVVLSGGGSRAVPRLSVESVTYLQQAQIEDLTLRRVPDTRFLWQPATASEGTVLVARARLDPACDLGRRIRPLAPRRPDEPRRPDRKGRLWRDVRLTAVVMREVLQVARAAGRAEVSSTLLASGGLRTFPASSSLVEMVRAWATVPERDRLGLTVHVADPEVVYDLVAGRIDVARLLAEGSGRGTIEFWLELIEREGSVSRLLMLEPPRRALRDVLAVWGVSGARWAVTVEPRPCLGWAPWTLDDVQAWERETGESMSLERLGVLHGSTLRLVETTRAHGAAPDPVA